MLKIKMWVIGFISLLMLPTAVQSFSPADIDPLLVQGDWTISFEGSSENCPIHFHASPLELRSGHVSSAPGRVEYDEECFKNIMNLTDDVSKLNLSGNGTPEDKWSRDSGGIFFRILNRPFIMSRGTNLYFYGKFYGGPNEQSRSNVVMFRDGFEDSLLRNKIINKYKIDQIIQSRNVHDYGNEKPNRYKPFAFVILYILHLLIVYIFISFCCRFIKHKMRR